MPLFHNATRCVIPGCSEKAENCVLGAEASSPLVSEKPMPEHTHQYTALADSDRVPRRGARVVEVAPADRTKTVTVYVRRDPSAEPLPDPDQLAMTPPKQRPRPSSLRAGADDQDLQKVRAFYEQEHGLNVEDVNRAAGSILFSGAVENLSHAFRVALHRYAYTDRYGHRRTYEGREGAIFIPKQLEGIITAVVGLDDRPLGLNLLNRRSGQTLELTGSTAPAIPRGVFLPTKLGDLYGFPAGTDGEGQCIAVLAFNGATPPGIASGGYQRDALQTYFQDVLHQPLPEITDVVVHGPGNDPGRDDEAAARQGDTTGEIMLDLQIVGALAPKARIVVYFSVFSEQGWVDVINRIVTDTENQPSVISCSYGNPEDALGSAWTRMTTKQVDKALALAARGNISICCASGDDGSRDQASDLRAHADFPASSPYVLGVGGTRLVSSNGSIAAETVWNDGPGDATGGGISSLFPLPAWQDNAHVPPSANLPHLPGRGVPDVAADADPQSGVLVISVDGRHLQPVGGTSAAAPQWAALLARVNQKLGARVGFLNPLLYTRMTSGVLHDITVGSNGAYTARPGWDPCTGWGSPDGQKLLDVLESL
jgi:kumamolisin